MWQNIYLWLRPTCNTRSNDKYVPLPLQHVGVSLNREMDTILTVHDRGILKKISTSKTEIGSVVPFYVQNNLPSSKFLKIPILGPKWGFFQKVRFWILKLLLKFYFFLKPAGKKSTSPPKPAINVDSKNLPTFENCLKNECIT